MTEKRFPPDVLIALIDGLLEDQDDVVVLADEAALLDMPTGSPARLGC